MSLDIEQRVAASRRRNRWAAAVGLLVLILVFLTIAGLLWGRDDVRTAEGPQPAPPSVEPTVTPVQPDPTSSLAKPTTAAPGELSGWVAPARQVTLPAGSDQIDEYPVGFPAEPLGAVAAEVSKDRFTTLDYAQANAVLRIYLAPQLADIADQASTSAVEQLRTKLAVPTVGAAPADAAVISRPIGVQWRELADGRVEVQVLVETDYRSAGRSRTELAAALTVWEWLDEPGRGQDWRAVEGRAPTAGLAEIGTADFNNAGWSAIVTEGSR